MSLQWILPPWAWPLLVLAGVVAVVLVRRLYQQTVPMAGPTLRRVLMGLRVTALVLLLVAVARPALLRLLPQRVPARVAVVVEDSGSMTLADAAAPGGGPADVSRWYAGWQLAGAVDSLVAARPGDPETVFLRGNGLRPPEPTTPARALGQPPEAVGTDLGALLAQVRQRFVGQPLRAVVVVSDGNATDGADAAARREIASPAEVWLVGVGDPTGPADRYLTDLRYPETAYQGEDVSVEVTVAHRFPESVAAADSVSVELRRDGEVLDRATGPPGDDLQRFTLTFSPREPGLQVLEVSVAPLGNERFLGNNRATLAVDVHKDRARLLVLAAVPGWDVRFLAQAALQESRLDLSVVYPGPDGPILADSLTAWQRPADVAGWQKWEGVVLAGSPGPLLVGDGRDLAEAVRRGTGLLVLAGDGPPGGRADPRGELPAALREILPVALQGPAIRPGDYVLVPAASEQRHPVLAGVTYGQDAGGLLSQLPPLRGLQPALARDEATVLISGRPVGRPERTGPVLVVGRAGSGRVLWFGGRRLWELAFWERPAQAADTGAHPGRRLLRNLLVWTAVGEQEAGVSLLGSRLTYQEGERIGVEVRWLDLRGQPVTGRPVTVEVESVGDRSSQPPRTFALEPVPDRPGVAAVDLPPLPPGRYLLTPQGGGDTPQVGPARPLVVTATSVEQTQVRQDRRGLRQLATRARGRVVDLGATGDRQRLLDSLASLDLGPEERQRQQRFDLWAGWPLLVLVVVLLGTEWLLRRRHGML